MNKILGVLLVSITFIQNGEAKKQKVVPCPPGAVWCVAETLQEPAEANLTTQINAASAKIEDAQKILEGIRTGMQSK